MDDLDLRLPTPPPLPPGAPTLPLPVKSSHFPRFATVEYPGPVHDVAAALDTVGGLARVSDVLGAPKDEESSKKVELNLMPDNPFFHTVPAHVSSTRNVVVRIVKRRRKRPIVDDEGKVVEEGVYSIQPVGIEHKTVRFRAMADFQYAPKVSKEDPTINLADAVRRMDIAGIRNFTMPEPVEDFPESAYLPPPSFSRHGLPQVFSIAPASSTVRTTTSSGAIRLINATRHKTRAVQAILFAQQTVPTEPEAAFLKELGRTELNEMEERMRELMQERPVWTRQAMLNQLTPEELKAVNNNKAIWPMVGYTFADGPFRDLVIRFDYDPRKDREARFYQHIQFRNASNVRQKALPGTRGLIQAQSATRRSDKQQKAQAVSNLSHEFDGQNVYSKIGNFQLCDISDPLLVRLIRSEAGVLDTCSSDINEGWYAYDYFDQMRQVVRRKWNGLLNGLAVSDEDCEDLLEWELSSESRAGQAKRSGTAAVEGGKGKGGGGAKGKGKKGKGKGKGRARGSDSEATASESGSGSGSGSGFDSAANDDDEEDDLPSDRGGGGSGSDAAESPAAAGTQQKGRKGRGSTRAPWELPKKKGNKAKQPESEGAVLARLNRSMRRSRGNPSYTPGPAFFEE
ncbi:hypothetical protein JCM8097_000787 [Rhodosporidiobolus ruineniae]